jgi:urease accessory protein UreF
LDELDAVAKALNLTAAQLVEQLSSGKSLAEIAKAQNVDEAKVKQAIIDAANAQLDRAVQAGLMTQAQANGLKARLTPDRIDLTRVWWWGFRWKR